MSYLFSFLAGMLVGVFYDLIGLMPPAPPLIALIGLLGMLVGEQTIPLAKEYLFGRPQIKIESQQSIKGDTNGRDS